MVEEIIHVVFDEADYGILSEWFNELNLNKHFDDERWWSRCQWSKWRWKEEPIQSLEDVEEKKVECIEDSQPDLETNAQNLEKPSERSDFDTPKKRLLKGSRN